MIVSETMPVTIFSQSASQITFQITTPMSTLFLGKLQVDGLPPGGNGVIGSLSPVGTAELPSVHNFHLGNTKFQQMRQTIANNPGAQLSIQITYDNATLLATDASLPALLKAG